MLGKLYPTGAEQKDFARSADCIRHPNLQDAALIQSSLFGQSLQYPLLLSSWYLGDAAGLFSMFGVQGVHDQ